MLLTVNDAFKAKVKFLLPIKLRKLIKCKKYIRLLLDSAIFHPNFQIQLTN